MAEGKTQLETLGFLNNNLKVSNIRNSGQAGIGYNLAFMDAAVPLVLPPAIFIVTATPTMFDDIDPQIGRMIKAMMETHSKSITGVDLETTLEFDEGAVGHDGQTLSTPTKARRGQVQPTFTYPELTGGIVYALHELWIRSIRDPDDNTSITQNSLPSEYSVSALMIQPDITGRAENVLKTVSLTNIVPTTTSTFSFDKNIGQAAMVERSIPCTAYLQTNATVDAIGREVYKELGYDRLDYNKRAASRDDVASTLSDTGILHEINTAVEEASNYGA